MTRLKTCSLGVSDFKYGFKNYTFSLLNGFAFVSYSLVKDNLEL